MNKSIIQLFAILSVTLSPLTASAQADSQYPAANFEPKVVFIDEAAASNTKGSTQASAETHAKKNEIDPQYPAAFFEPKVIFP
jgi:hypothetical protein